MNYSLPSTEELTRLAPELISHVIKNENIFWYVKYKAGSRDEEKRDLLTYLLGKDICNIAEVRLLSEVEHGIIKSQLNLNQSSDRGNTFLVRLASSYDLSELPNKDIEKAVATELVFSVWIRRRDTHADNRVYVEGIPIFFDHQTAFLSEPQFAHSSAFFIYAPDYGHPAFWKIRLLQKNEIMDTMRARNVANLVDKAHHYVYDVDVLKKEIDHAKGLVKEIASHDLKNKIEQSGFSKEEVELINNFLLCNIQTLDNDIAYMNKIIFN